jgi:ribonuclease D
VLQALCAYRDQFARKVNLPHFKVLSNELLVEITRANPSTLDELKEVPGMSANVFQRHHAGLLQAVTTGKTATPPKRERMPRPDQGVLNRLNSLHDWRKEQGKRLEVESDVVLPREYMEKIAFHNPVNLTELNAIMQKIPWRFERYGSAILAAMTRKEAHENII